MVESVPQDTESQGFWQSIAASPTRLQLYATGFLLVLFSVFSIYTDTFTLGLLFNHYIHTYNPADVGLGLLLSAVTLTISLGAVVIVTTILSTIFVRWHMHRTAQEQMPIITHAFIGLIVLAFVPVVSFLFVIVTPLLVEETTTAEFNRTQEVTLLSESVEVRNGDHIYTATFEVENGTSNTYENARYRFAYSYIAHKIEPAGSKGRDIHVHSINLHGRWNLSPGTNIRTITEKLVLPAGFENGNLTYDNSKPKVVLNLASGIRDVNDWNYSLGREWSFETQLVEWPTIIQDLLGEAGVRDIAEDRNMQIVDTTRDPSDSVLLSSTLFEVPEARLRLRYPEELVYCPFPEEGYQFFYAQDGCSYPSDLLHVLSLSVQAKGTYVSQPSALPLIEVAVPGFDVLRGTKVFGPSDGPLQNAGGQTYLLISLSGQEVLITIIGDEETRQVYQGIVLSSLEEF